MSQSTMTEVQRNLRNPDMGSQTTENRVKRMRKWSHVDRATANAAFRKFYRDRYNRDPVRDSKASVNTKSQRGGSKIYKDDLYHLAKQNGLNVTRKDTKTELLGKLSIL